MEIQKENIAIQSLEYFSPSANFRWLVPPHTTTAGPKLQQAWLSNHGRVDWKDVPTVVGEASDTAA